MNKFRSKSDTTRRGFIKTSAGAIAGMAMNVPDNRSAADTRSNNIPPKTTKNLPGRRQPNILVLMTDHGKTDVLKQTSQCRTPNLDKLASDGVHFTRCYTPTGMCSPARASLMTGTYASTHGLWDCTHTQRKEWVDVSPQLTQWAQLLSGAGYQTGYFGKWHASQNKNIDQYGWQEYEIKNSPIMKGEYIEGSKILSQKRGYNDYLLAAVRQDDKENPHHPAYNLGINFIKRHAADDRPFCCFVSTREPGENMPLKKFYDMYDADNIKTHPTLKSDLKGKNEILRRMRSIWQDLSDDDWKKITACNYAEMTFIDSEIGRILQTLHETGTYENTIILYLADHGQMLGAHGLMGVGYGLAYEDVYNVPLIIRLPQWMRDRAGKQKGRTIDKALVSLVDICPTLLELCGLDTPQQVQGRSLVPLLENRADPADWQTAYGEFYGQRFMYSQRIVWNGDWKYIFSPAGVDELYHLKDDPFEENNLAADARYRGVLETMVAHMWRKMEQIGDESLLNTDYATLRVAPFGPHLK